MESEIFYLHRGEDYNELAEMEHYIDEIKKSAQYALCGGKIGKDFIDSSLDNSTFLFVHKSEFVLIQFLELFLLY